MAAWGKEAEAVMAERFGTDTVIPLATVEDGIPYVRSVNALYVDGAFYFVTDARSNKVRHIQKEPTVASAGEWFTAHGKAVDLGPWGDEANRQIAQTLRNGFADWIDNGHHDLSDVNTRILRIDLTDAVLYSHGTRYERS